MFHRQVTPLIIPVHTAYITPDPYGMEIRENQPTALTNPAQTLTWFGKLSKGVCEIKMKACVGHAFSGTSSGTSLQWEKLSTVCRLTG